MADQGWSFKVVLSYEAFNIFGHDRVVMPGTVRRVTVISQIDIIDRTVEIAC